MLILRHTSKLLNSSLKFNRNLRYLDSHESPRSIVLHPQMLLHDLEKGIDGASLIVKAPQLVSRKAESSSKLQHF